MRNKKTPKRWGTTEAIHNEPGFSIHRIEFNEGYECSVHHHEVMHNGFYIESGEMVIHMQDYEGRWTTEHLKAGDKFVVRRGTVHKFEGRKSGVAFEYYWTDMPGFDIVRQTEGGEVG